MNPTARATTRLKPRNRPKTTTPSKPTRKPTTTSDGDDSGGGETVEVKVPDIGDFDSVEVIEVLVAEGDTVEKEQPLITLESDKATLEVPSSAAGNITELKVAEGSTVSEGDVIALVESSGGGKSSGDKSEKKSGGDKQSASQSQSRSGSDKAAKKDDDKDSEEPSKSRSGTASKDNKPHDSGVSGGDPSKLRSWMKTASARPTPRPACASTPVNSVRTWARRGQRSQGSDTSRTSSPT